MSRGRLSAEQVQALSEALGPRLQRAVPLASYTAARIGGPADYLIVVRSREDLAAAARLLWQVRAPFRVIGGGSNLLVADAGVREVVMLNQARRVRFAADDEEMPWVWAESGAALGSVARRAVERGWSGLEWAATVPGTVGGAVVGNAGAFGGDMAHSLHRAEVVVQGGESETWPVSRLDYAYRDSWLKRNPGTAVVLSATMALTRSTPEATRARVAEFVAQRQQTQPGGASMGSMFKNPPGDHAGRLIEAAGLKGLRQGGAQISIRHANFFINLGGATAADVWALIETARNKVAQEFGVNMELEVERIGDWPEEEGVPASSRRGAS
ncbi:MAG: UDP-N-acetylmuramate dehydrogenase [Chloroflexota bacterium]